MGELEATSRFNAGRNQQKKLEGLKGILAGISADRLLNKEELLYLDTWLRDAGELRGNADVIDLLDQISDVLADGIITQEEMDDTLTLIEDIDKYGLSHELHYREEALLNQALGFASGISADDEIREEELTLLVENLTKLDSMPVCRNLLKDIERLKREDNIVGLLACVKRFCGQEFPETGAAQNASLLDIFDSVDKVDLLGSRICFSGLVLGVPRSKLREQSENFGCYFDNKVTLSTDILVVGEEASRDWIYSALGRKIERAMELREKGHKICIITAKNWCSLVEASDKHNANFKC